MYTVQYGFFFLVRETVSWALVISAKDHRLENGKPWRLRPLKIKDPIYSVLEFTRIIEKTTRVNLPRTCEKKRDEEKEKSYENRENINQKQEAGNIRRKQEFSSQNSRVGISESN